MTTQRPRVTRNTAKFKDLLRDTRFWRVAGQVIAVLLFLLLVILVVDNVIYNLRALGIQLGFGFLGSQASFDIGETLISYNPADSYGRAILVGLVNSLRVIVVGLVLATILGLVAGIARLSNNWLVRQLALVYVETIRNIPLLLQLFFWYFAFFLQLPNVANQITLPGSTYLSSRGLYLPWIQGGAGAGVWLLLLALGITGAIAVWRWRTQVMQERGVRGNQMLWALAPIVVAIALAYIINGAIPFSITLPQLVGTEQIEGGLRLSPEFGTLLLGLVIYTGSFIAEIVRAGIQAVPQGQWEAARALGLKSGRIMQSVVLPQALRVIIPPLTSQYLNLAKNSSLAIAIGFPDVYFVASTTFNQTGRAVEVMFLIMITYLTISLIISLAMNLFNRTVQFKER